MESFRQFSSECPSDGVCTSERTRRRLERLWLKPAADRHASAHPWLVALGHSLLRFLTGEQQVRIWQKRTRLGLVWCAYDPVSEQIKSCGSEEELRSWLEYRHRAQ